MTPRRLAPLALAVAAACGSATPTAEIRFLEPTAVVVFNGITVQTPGTVKPYFAVANAGRADLTLLDAVSGQAVAAPVVLRSLAIPTPSARPSLLVSARLGDDLAPPPGQPQTHRPDLLVAVGTGSSQLELVSTWGADGVVSIPNNGVVDLGAGAEILAAIATPIVGGGAVASGRVRLIAALSGRQLAVVVYARTPTSTQPDAIAPVGPPVIVKLPFQPLAVAIDPDEVSGTPAALHLYAATLDPLTRPDGSRVFGVAMLDATLPPGDAWAASPSLQLIDARAPTRLVAAATVEERKPDAAGNFPSSPPGLPSSPFQSPAVRRVYAFLDPSSCGPDQRIDCGIAVLDPTPTALGLVPDYSIGSPTTGTPMPYLAPIFVPSVPVALSISKPPAVPIDSSSTTGNQFAGQYMPLVAGTGVRATSAVAAVAAADGRVYIVDLSRWQIPSDVSILRDTAASPTRTRASAMATIGVVDQQPDPRFFRSRELGVWDVTNPAKPALVVGATGDALSNINVVRVTPGFTPSDVWRIKYQGTLPGLSVRTAETGPTGTGGTWLAMQLTSGGTQIDVARLYDPTLAVQGGDIVIISAAELTSAQCAPLQATATAAALNVETQITAILAPSGAYPGGAVVVQPLDGPNGTTQWRDCFNAEIAGQAHSADKGSALRAEVIAGGYVMVGDQTGYAGRPAVVADPTPATAFALAYQNEDALSCPILPWPAALPTATTDPFYACTDATCRSACESLVLARKARRTYHLADACSLDVPGADARCFQVWPTAQYPFPQATGPVISFRLGLQERFVAAPGITVMPPPTNTTTATPARGLELDLTTVDALSPTFRRAPSGAGDVVYPTGGITAFDRSPYKASDSYRFFVTFGSDFVLDFSPALAQNTGNVYR